MFFPAARRLQNQQEIAEEKKMNKKTFLELEFLSFRLLLGWLFLVFSWFNRIRRGIRPPPTPSERQLISPEKVSGEGFACWDRSKICVSKRDSSTSQSNSKIVTSFNSQLHEDCVFDLLGRISVCEMKGSPSCFFRLWDFFIESSISVWLPNSIWKIAFFWKINSTSKEKF